MDDKKHIDPQHFSMDDLEHIAACDFCAERFADSVEAHGLLTAPVNMKQEILSRSRQFDVQIVAKSNQASKKLEFFYYTLKVGFAAAFAIAFLVFSPAFSHVTDSFHLPPAVHSQYRLPSASLYDKAQQITDKINDFTYQLFHMEVTSDDKQEK